MFTNERTQVHLIRIRQYRKSDLQSSATIAWNLWRKFFIRDCTAEGARWWQAHLAPVKSNMDKIGQRYAAAPISLVATDKGKVIGMVMGTKDELLRLFVHHRYHGKGVGRKLMQRYEAQCLRHVAISIRVLASLYAVPFYTRNGYKKTTGIRNCKGLKVQPMKKVL